MVAFDESAKNVRITGHGRTFWLWQDQIIAFVNRFTHQTPTPISEAVDIQPINHIRPMGIATGRAITRGEITMEIIEPYEGRVWDVLRASAAEPFFTEKNGDRVEDLADIFHYFQANHSTVSPRLVRIIRPPTSDPYSEEYHGIQILDVQGGEDTGVDGMINPLQIRVGYTRSSRPGPAVPATANDRELRHINSKVY